MNCRAQAGLEYLMTYGWALVIIVTIVSILFITIQAPTSSFQCTSSDPTKIVMESYNAQLSLNTTNQQRWLGKMTLINGTGGPIRINKVVYVSGTAAPGDGCTYGWTTLYYLSPFYGSCLSTVSKINEVLVNSIDSANTVSVNSGQKITIDPFCLGKRTGSSCLIANFSGHPNPGFRIEYIDQFGYAKAADINCSGYPPVS